jgi:hypothetical protein
MKYQNKILFITLAIMCMVSFWQVSANPIIHSIQDKQRIERDAPSQFPYCDNRIYCVGEDCHLLETIQNNKPCLVCACS